MQCLSEVSYMKYLFVWVSNVPEQCVNVFLSISDLFREWWWVCYLLRCHLLWLAFCIYISRQVFVSCILPSSVLFMLGLYSNIIIRLHVWEMLCIRKWISLCNFQVHLVHNCSKISANQMSLSISLSFSFV